MCENRVDISNEVDISDKMKKAGFVFVNPDSPENKKLFERSTHLGEKLRIAKEIMKKNAIDLT
jgi:hypothetical protein